MCCFGNVWLELKMDWEQLVVGHGNGEGWVRGVSVQGDKEGLSGRMRRVTLHLHRGLHHCIQRLAQTLADVGQP